MKTKKLIVLFLLVWVILALLIPQMFSIFFGVKSPGVKHYIVSGVSSLFISLLICALIIRVRNIKNIVKQRQKKDISFDFQMAFMCGCGIIFALLLIERWREPSKRVEFFIFFSLGMLAGYIIIWIWQKIFGRPNKGSGER